MRTLPSMCFFSFLFFYFMARKGTAKLTMNRSWIKSLTGKMKGKPLLDLVGSIVEDYEYLWENYYFPTATL